MFPSRKNWGKADPHVLIQLRMAIDCLALRAFPRAPMLRLITFRTFSFVGSHVCGRKIICINNTVTFPVPASTGASSARHHHATECVCSVQASQVTRRTSWSLCDRFAEIITCDLIFNIYILYKEERLSHHVPPHCRDISANHRGKFS